MGPIPEDDEPRKFEGSGTREDPFVVPKGYATGEYPEGYGRCVLCGADRNEPCVVISGSGVPDDQAGSRRAHPHGGRAPIGSPREPREGFVPIADEPGLRSDVREPGYAAVGDMPEVGMEGPSAERDVILNPEVAAHMAAAGTGELVQGHPAESKPEEGPPFINAATEAVGCRNAREMGYWILGAIGVLRTVKVHVRIPAEHLAGVSAVLVAENFRVSRWSGSFIAGEHGEITLEVEVI